MFELEFGVQLLPQGQRRNRLRTMNDSIISSYNDRILPLERSGAEWAAIYRVQAHREGRRLRLSDALIAGIAKANDLTLATRNVRDFEGLDVEVFNPWKSCNLMAQFAAGRNQRNSNIRCSIGVGIAAPRSQ